MNGDQVSPDAQFQSNTAAGFAALPRAGPVFFCFGETIAKRGGVSVSRRWIFRSKEFLRFIEKD
jgi:hypothetical protein